MRSILRGWPIVCMLLAVGILGCNETATETPAPHRSPAPHCSAGQVRGAGVRSLSPWLVLGSAKEGAHSPYGG